MRVMGMSLDVEIVQQHFIFSKKSVPARRIRWHTRGEIFDGLKSVAWGTLEY